MRKDVNKKSNNKSKVVSALAMLLVSAVALSSASYAWFTMSKQVEVKGIELTATAPDNVLICNNDADYTKIEKYNSTKTLVSGTKDMYKGGTTTTLATTDLLLPSSSTNGVKLYHTININDDGSDKGNNENTGSNYLEATNETTATELYYVDIPLYILTTGSKDINVAIDTQNSSISPKKNADGVSYEQTEIYKAARFAILDGAQVTNNIGGTFEADSTMFAGATPVSELAENGKATYENTNSATKLDGTKAGNGTEIRLVGTKNATANVTENKTSKYQYKKVIVRVWIEGQNAACITKNANQSFDVKLVFKYTSDAK